METQPREPAPYLVQHIRERLAGDPRVGEIDIQVSIEGDHITLTGHVGTEERRRAIPEVLGDLVAGYDLRNDTIVNANSGDPEEDWL